MSKTSIGLDKVQSVIADKLDGITCNLQQVFGTNGPTTAGTLKA